MAIKTIEKRVGEDLYRIKQLGSDDADAVLMRLTKTLGPVLGALGGGEGSALGRAADEFSKRVSLEDLTHLRKLFASTTEAHPADAEEDDQWLPLASKGALDQHFAGRPKAKLLWLVACLEVNFADFFDASTDGLLASLKAAFETKASSASASPTE